MTPDAAAHRLSFDLGSIPVPPTTLVGRDRLLTDLTALLARPDVRLVTLIGPGGVGKTRLALQAASTASTQIAGWICFVSFLTVHDPAMIAASIAQALGIRHTDDDGTLFDRIATALGVQPTLLVLDNFEQLVDGAAVVADLLSAAPSLTVMATSRVRLHLSGEHVYPVPPLDIPASEIAPGVDEVAQSPAVRLFVTRARAANPAFELTSTNAGAVAEICRRLDGIPLAIELAAAWIPILNPAEMLDRMQPRLQLLVGGNRDLPERQRTMERTIAWSYDLLSSEDQALFRQLAVFVDGFSLDGAEAVAGPGFPTIAGVASLVNKSLLQIRVGPAGDTRYRMLETVGEFALARLEERDEARLTRSLHAAWCADVAERMWQRLVRRVDKSDLDTLEREHGNLRAALDWLDRTGDDQGFLKLAGALGEFWQFRGHRREGLRWLNRALYQAQNADIPTSLHIRALHGASWLARDLGELHHATALAEECLAVSQNSNDPRDRALIPELLGYTALAAGDYERAATLATQAQSQFEALGYQWLAAATLTDHALAQYGTGDIARAEAVLRDALDRFRAIDDAWYPQLILVYLSLTAIEQQEPLRAATHLLESLDLWQAIGSRDRLTQWLAAVATLAATHGRPDAAARLFGAVASLREVVGFAFALPERASFERGESIARQALADPVFQAAQAFGSELSLEQAVSNAAGLLSSVIDASGTAQEQDPATRAGLTGRETEVLRLLAAGRTDRQIADALFIGHRTVGTHVSRVLGKLGVASRVEAAAWAIHHGVV